MLKKTVRVMILLGVGVFFMTSLALAKTNTINLNRDFVLPDGQTLKAGVYVVVVDEKLDQIQFIQHGAVVVTHRCKCIQQEKKNEVDALLTLREPPNKDVLQGISFKGETRIITLPS